MDTDIIISKNLKKYRKENGLTLKRVADYLHVHPTTVQKWESGKNRIYPCELDSLSKLYKVRVSDIMNIKDLEDGWSSRNEGHYEKLLYHEYSTFHNTDSETEIIEEIQEQEEFYKVDNYISMNLDYNEYVWAHEGHIPVRLERSVKIIFKNYKLGEYGHDYKDIFHKHRKKIEKCYNEIIAKILDDTLTYQDIKEYNIEYIEAFNINISDRYIFKYIDNNEMCYHYETDSLPVECVMDMTDKKVYIKNEVLDDIELINIGTFLGKAISDYEEIYPDISEIAAGENCENIIKFGFVFGDDQRAVFQNNGILESILRGGIYQCTNAKMINKAALFVLEYVKSSDKYECGIMLDVCRNRHLYKETIEKIYNDLYESDKKYDNFYIPKLDRGCTWALASNSASTTEILTKIYQSIPKTLQLRNDKELYNLQLRLALLNNGVRKLSTNILKRLVYEIDETRNNYEKSKGTYETQWSDICFEPTYHCLKKTQNNTLLFPYGENVHRWDRSTRIDDIFEEYDELEITGIKKAVDF